MDAAVAALIGAAIGAAGSIGGMWLQQRHQTRRERLKVAADLAISDHNSTLELAKAAGARADVAPLSSYVIFHAQMLDCIADGDITAAKVTEIKTKLDDVLAVFPKHVEGEKP